MADEPDRTFVKSASSRVVRCTLQRQIFVEFTGASFCPTQSMIDQDMIDLKPRLNEPAIRELVSFSVGNPTPERLEHICQQYQRAPDSIIMGSERQGMVVGCVGLEICDLRQGRVRCISVLPSARRQDIGRRMLNQIAVVTGLTHLIAETDQDAVGFYRQCGFQTESLGELYPGMERFRCVKDL